MSGEERDLRGKERIFLNREMTVAEFMEQLLAIELYCQDDDGSLQEKLAAYYDFLTELDQAKDGVMWAENEKGQRGPMRITR